MHITQQPKNLSLKNILTIVISTLFVMFSATYAQANNGWENQKYKVKGTWSIEKKATGNYITLSSDFKTRKAPDLKIFLSKNVASKITGKTATNNAAFVAKLSSHKGGQSYKIPANININDYQSLVIHCEQFTKLWAATSLR